MLEPCKTEHVNNKHPYEEQIKEAKQAGENSHCIIIENLYCTGDYSLFPRYTSDLNFEHSLEDKQPVSNHRT